MPSRVSNGCFIVTVEVNGKIESRFSSALSEVERHDRPMRKFNVLVDRLLHPPHKSCPREDCSENMLFVGSGTMSSYHEIVGWVHWSNRSQLSKY